MNKYNYTFDQWCKIGKAIASTWGANFEYHQVLENGDVRFFCIEHGERFYTDLTAEQIKKYL